MDRQRFVGRQVVDDNSFLKPLARSSAAFLAKHCTAAHSERKMHLLYIARLEEFKGQRSFLETVSPSLLGNYSVQFYGVGTAEAKLKLLDIASRRGIKIAIRGAVTRVKLLQHLCRARGVVHWAESDINPRAAYEGLYAGLPLLITRRSAVPDALLQQPFVTATDWGEDLNAAFSAFLGTLNTDWRQDHRWHAFVHERLSAPRIYRQICADIGLCQLPGASQYGSPQAHGSWLSSSRDQLRLS